MTRTLLSTRGSCSAVISFQTDLGELAYTVFVLELIVSEPFCHNANFILENMSIFLKVRKIPQPQNFHQVQFTPTERDGQQLTISSRVLLSTPSSPYSEL